MGQVIFFFNDTATTEIYTLSLHDALPIWIESRGVKLVYPVGGEPGARVKIARSGSVRKRDRKSTRLNSSHSQISYAVFCLKKKKIMQSKLGARLSIRHSLYSCMSMNPPQV